MVSRELCRVTYDEQGLMKRLLVAREVYDEM